LDLGKLVKKHMMCYVGREDIRKATKSSFVGGIEVIFRKEKEVIDLITKHLDKVEECLATALRAVETYINGDISEAKALALQVDNIETEADLIRYNIRDRLYSGAYLPMVREDIYNLVESMDKVADAAEACCDFFLDQRPEIPEDMKDQFLHVAQESFSVMSSLKEGMLAYVEGEGDVKTIREKAKQIGVKESDVDRIEWDLTRQIFTSSLDHAHRIHLRLCLDTIVEISDRGEDAADQLELATMKMRV
jgi:predicted phosphate transport protein (TIGR00153 family)